MVELDILEILPCAINKFFFFNFWRFWGSTFYQKKSVATYSQHELFTVHTLCNDTTDSKGLLQPVTANSEAKAEAQWQKKKRIEREYGASRGRQREAAVEADARDLRGNEPRI